jgi:hypothetical protein
MNEVETPNASNLTRRNSIGRGLKTVSFEVDQISKKSTNQDKLLLSQQTTMLTQQNTLSMLEKEVHIYRSRVEILEKKLDDLIDG